MKLVRGFPVAEYQNRLARAQKMMAQAGLDALLLTTEAELRYFTGFLTRFWESPTRPWFLVVPASGKPVAVIPAIGAEVMGRTWIDDIRTWQSPDPIDDGVSLLADTLVELAGAGGTVGTPDRDSLFLRMPLADWARVQAAAPGLKVAGDSEIIRRLRNIKSPAEIEKIANACKIGSRAFARVPEIARVGVPLEEVYRKFQMLCLDEGADWVPYLAGGAATGGLDDIISPATDRPLADGDVLMLDTGVIWDGYFCDFDRNWAIGHATDEVRTNYAKTIDASNAAFEIAKPGNTIADLFHAMDKITTGGAGGSDAGRYGHGLGMQLTEWPSIIPSEHMPLEAGMVLTLEPGVVTPSGRTIVHEENIAITDGDPYYLSEIASADILVLS
jgi:Xaa-Pro aminopeptidase